MEQWKWRAGVMRVEPIIIFTLPTSHIPTQGCYHNNMRLPAKIFIFSAKKACKDIHIEEYTWLQRNRWVTHMPAKSVFTNCLQNTAVITISVLLI